MNLEKFYVTIPICYPSDKLHIGHIYCTVTAGVTARYKRLQGCKVMFLTGTDEHDQKIEDKVKEAGVSPKEFVDHIVESPRGVFDLWRLMNISNDRFIRTTDDYRVESVQKVFKQPYEQEDIYRGKYVGKYCKPCESFQTKTQLKDGKCPDCGRDVVDAEEEVYLLRLSKHADRIRHLLEDTDFLEPRSRVNEMVNNFIRPGLEDLCVSHTLLSWGVSVDSDPGHVAYVWVDAPSNYINALGYDNGRYHNSERFWPADVYFIGKETVRFHAIIWPTIPMALGLPLLKKVHGRDWLLLDGSEMSKSEGNVVNPYLLVERCGVDALCCFLLRGLSFGTGGNFSDEALISRINTDLTDDLGNLVSRTIIMVGRYFGKCLPGNCDAIEDEAELAAMLVQTQGEVDLSMDLSGDDPRKCGVELITLAAGLRGCYEAQMEHYAFQDTPVELLKLIGQADKYIDENKPWVLAKGEVQKPHLVHVLCNLLECVRLLAVLLIPFISGTCEKIFAQLDVDEGARTWESAGAWSLFPVGVVMSEGENLFPRISVEKELAVLDELQTEVRRAALPAAEVELLAQESIDFDVFCKSGFRTVKVKACENVEESIKLLRFILDDSSGTDCQILSGIVIYYKPKELMGETLVAIINLPPRKVMGQESCNTLLSAVHTEHEEEKLHLVMADDAIPAGAKLC